MIVVFGKRSARIARFTDTAHRCYPCGSYDREVSVYRSYFHLCLIPVFPMGRRFIEMQCRVCGDQTALDSVTKEYLPQAKTPFWFLSFPILVLLVGSYWFYWNSHNQQENAAFVNKPAVGDIYCMYEEKTNETDYSFLRVISVTRDSVFVLHNRYNYLGFVSRLDGNDYFLGHDTFGYSKNELQNMLAEKQIRDVQRHYDSLSSFNRIH